MDRPVAASGLNEPLAALDAARRHKTIQPHLPDYHHDPPDYFPLPDVAASASRDASSYKQLKEAWIADQSGSSIHMTNALGLVMLSTYAVWAVLRAKRLRFVSRQHRRAPHALASPMLSAALSVADKLSDWQLEFAILVVPAVCAHTLLASHLVTTNLVLLAVCALLVRAGPPLPRASQPAREQRQKRHWSEKYSDDEEEEAEQLHDDHPHPHDHDYHDPDDQHDDALRDMPRRTIESNSSDTELPFRVSIDSSADAAHAGAAPPNFYDGPGSLRSDPDESGDTFIRTAPTSPLLDPPRSLDGRHLSPVMASTSTFASSSSKRSLELSSLRTSAFHSPHGSDVDALSVVSASSAMSPLARSVVDPLNRNIHASINHSTSDCEKLASRGPSLQPTRSEDASTLDRSMFVRPQPFLTVYRAHMMLVTIISILAVDFPAFPRSMSKCESWGTSWMDMGVGSFVFSMGIISALPFLKSPQNRFRPLRQQVVADFKKALPLLVLGSVRVAMVKGVEYPEHVTEYGVHWNFFITLGLLPFAATLSRPFAKHIRYSALGLGLSCVHQLLLRFTVWQSWALGQGKRDTLLRQNKEGVTSMVGYLAIFYIGLDLGHYVLPLDPYYAYRKLRKRSHRPRTDKLAMVLASLAILWWCAYALCRLVGLQTSRRLANLAYVLWVVAFNTSFLLGYVLVYMFMLQGVEHERGEAGDAVTPMLIQDLNRHSLAVFLVANLLTGVVNLTINTMYTRHSIAVGILLVYTGACCALASQMTRMDIRLKL